MNKKKKIILISSISILLIIIAIFTFAHYKSKKNITDICKAYSQDNIQNRLTEDNTIRSEDVTNIDLIENTTQQQNSYIGILEKKNNRDVLGVIKIDKIKYEGLVYEGTDLDTLSKGVGHFKNSSHFDGNVCVAAHNTLDKWAKLHTLKVGDSITYTSFIGTKEYYVETIKQIEETDWSMLEDTEDNRITLVTCVKSKPNLRLCVQACEK